MVSSVFATDRNLEFLEKMKVGVEKSMHFLNTLGLQRSLPSIELNPLIVVFHIARANLVFLFRARGYFIDVSAKVYLKRVSETFEATTRLYQIAFALMNHMNNWMRGKIIRVPSVSNSVTVCLYEINLESNAC